MQAKTIELRVIVKVTFDLPWGRLAAKNWENTAGWSETYRDVGIPPILGPDLFQFSFVLIWLVLGLYIN